MDKPIYILAGQSNARAVHDATKAYLEKKFGMDGYVLINVSAPGAPLTVAREGADWRGRDELYDQLVGSTSAALSDHANASIAGIIWVQGEADTHEGTLPASYGNDLELLLQNFRIDVAMAHTGRATNIETAPVVLGALSRQAESALTRTHWEAIIEEQHRIASSNPLIHLLDPDSLAAEHGTPGESMFLDGLHYAMDFRTLLAKAFVEQIDRHQTSTEAGSELGEGDDVLYSSADLGPLSGGGGNDTYFLGKHPVEIVEKPGAGTDLAVVEANYNMAERAAHVERLSLSGAEDFWVHGNDDDNLITGNAGDNLLRGGKGADILYGFEGNDRFVDGRGANRFFGGDGDDTYRISHHENRLNEREGEGHDRVLASISLSLRFHSQHIEDLKLLGKQDIDGTGNALANRILGNAGANHLDGAWGDDTIKGKRGNDTLKGDRGDDRLMGGPGRDVFLFGGEEGHDTIADFNPARDAIQFSSDIDLSQLEIWQSGRDTIFSSSDHWQITIEETESSVFSLDDFLF